MFSQRSRFYYIALGFLCGFAFVIGCGGGGGGGGTPPAGAQEVVNAVNVLYSNAVSSLTATNVQAAIDEICSQMATP